MAEHRSSLCLLRQGLLALLWLVVLAPVDGRCADDGSTIFTLWPLVDYRASAEDDFSNLALGGPLVKYEKSRDKTRYGLRPFYFHEEYDGVEYNDYLYPVATSERTGSATSFQFLHLLTTETGSDESGSKREYMLFPFLFYGEPSAEESYFAFFPLGGKILNKYGRDRIEFALFPLYAKTTKGSTENLNLLWPIFTRTSGENESGWALWPLYGTGEKTGVYRKSFFLWPFFFSVDDRLNTPDPRHTRAFFPLFVFADSPGRTDHTYLWPFFSHVEDSRKDYEEWNFPWPLFTIAHGKDRDVHRFLPFYGDERIRANRNRWFLWPLYKIEEINNGGGFSRRRDRVLFFLYSDLTERFADEEDPQLRRIAFWPLFTYERREGISQFYTLSLLEPFFPENERIERNWSPLWRIYQKRWDDHGGEVTSFLWNLYWKEKRGEDLALEIFPLFFYQRQGQPELLDVSLLKGIYRYRRGDGEACTYLLYLPWGICRAIIPAEQLSKPDQE